MIEEALEKFVVQLMVQGLECPSAITFSEQTFERIAWELFRYYDNPPIKMPEAITLNTSAGPVVIKKEIEQAPVVYLQKRPRSDNWYVSQFPSDMDTHKARLVCIEEIGK